MNTARMAILGVASIAGVACVGIFMHGLAGAKPPAQVVVAAPPPVPMQQVLVASRDIAVGERIQGGDMAWAPWPASAVAAGYVTQGPPTAPTPPQGQLGAAAGRISAMANTAMSNPAAGAGSTYVGAIVRDRIARNEPLTAAKVVRAGQSGVMAVMLDPGMRAVALPLSPESAAGGFVLPGDHVDVILTRAPDPALLTKTASTVVRNVRVLAIDQTLGGSAAGAASGKPGAGQSVVGATGTVEATPKQAEDLILAKASGTLSLALRSYADAAGGSQTGVPADNVRVFHPGATPTFTMVSR